jgi:hypothetical protein
VKLRYEEKKIDKIKRLNELIRKKNRVRNR